MTRIVAKIPEIVNLPSLDNPVAWMRFRCNISQAFHNKTNLAGEQAALSNSFHPRSLTLAQLITHITTGKAFTLGAFRHNRRAKTTFTSGQLLALDFDTGAPETTVAALAAHSFVQQYAFLVYPTPSSTPEHPKTRVLFALSEDVEEVPRWETLQRGLLKHFAALSPDPACKDAARLFYGSDKPGWMQFDNLLPIEIAGALTFEEAAADYQKSQLKPIERRPANLNNSRDLRYAEATIQGILGDYSAIPGGIGQRHNAFIAMAARLTGMRKGGWPGCENIEHDIETIGRATERGEKEITDAIRWARDNAEAIDFALPNNPLWEQETSYQAAENTESYAFVSDIPIFQDLDALEPGTYVIKSPKGTGKTDYFEEVVDHSKAAHRPVIVILPRISLTEDASQRLDIESQVALYPDQQRQQNFIATTAPSIVNHIDPNTGALREFPVVIIDESELLIKSLFGDHLKDEQRTRIFGTLEGLVRNAEYVFCADADAGELTQTFLESQRDDIHWIENPYRPEKRALTMYETKEAVLAALDKALAEHPNGVIKLDCSSDTDALAWSEHYQQQGFKVLCVCSETRNEPAVRDFAKSPDEHAGSYDLIVATSAMGTGVDISQTPQHAVFAIFDNMPLDAWEMHQQIMRFRNPQHGYHVWVSAKQVRLETNAAAIEQRRQNAEDYTRRITQHIFDQQGNNILLSQRRRMNQLAALAEARSNRSLRDVRAHFLALAEGFFTIVQGQDIDPDHSERIKATSKAGRSAVKERRRARIKQAAPVEQDTYKRLAIQAKVTPEVEAGHQRWKIEQLYGQGITDETLDDFDDGKGIARLKAFESIYQAQNEARAHDLEQLYMGVYAGDLHHATAKRRLLLYALEPFVEERCLSAGKVLDRAFLETWYEGFKQKYEHEIRLFWRWRQDYSDDPMQLLRFILGQIGLKVVRYGKRPPSGQQDTQRYRLCPETLTKMKRYLEQRRAAQVPDSVLEDSLEFDHAA